MHHTLQPRREGAKRTLSDKMKTIRHLWLTFPLSFPPFLLSSLFPSFSLIPLSLSPPSLIPLTFPPSLLPSLSLPLFLSTSLPSPLPSSPSPPLCLPPLSNCPDYDLCEHCEKKSDTIHPADHVFLKLKTPTRRAGLNKKGKMKPLLRKNLYMPHPDFSSRYVCCTCTSAPTAFLHEVI